MPHNTRGIRAQKIVFQIGLVRPNNDQGCVRLLCKVQNFLINPSRGNRMAYPTVMLSAQSFCDQSVGCCQTARRSNLM
ncbi:hypothetical protein SAMN05444000_1023 [Shimia gijangensis]|uniref:Uncharacterized protein n=1 Tax=Shimia gijangensis TaxID=1470563 RepID=A0A1M6C8G8_9RHOB|nr:hypothetical protein SAMN05444000_1023 [Shimia gijangensis]